MGCKGWNSVSGAAPVARREAGVGGSGPQFQRGDGGPTRIDPQGRSSTASADRPEHRSPPEAGGVLGAQPLHRAGHRTFPRRHPLRDVRGRSPQWRPAQHRGCAAAQGREASAASTREGEVEPASRAVEGPRDAERRRREDLRRVDRRALQAPVLRPSGSRRESAHHVKASVETGIATRARDPPGERSRRSQQLAPHAPTRPFCDHQRGRAPQPWVSVRRACEPMNGESAEMQVVGAERPGLVLYSSAAASVWPGSRRCSPGMSVRHRAGSRSYGGGLPPPGA